MKMSKDDATVDTSPSCAYCGIAEVDDIKLKECANCDLVRYCSDDCQRDHKSEHDEACNKRAAEFRDELLFKQPEGNHLGDCPICCLPMPFDIWKSTSMGCCSKTICNGCAYFNGGREMEASLVPSCPFCRKAISETDVEADKRRMKRVEANDPVAIYEKGAEQYKKANYISTFDYLTKAAQLGDIASHAGLSHLYDKGHGVEKDTGKAISSGRGYHWWASHSSIQSWNTRVDQWEYGESSETFDHRCHTWRR